MSRYLFIEAEKRNHAVAIICRVLKVSRAAYYKWCQRPVSARELANVSLLEEITKVHEASDGQYGSPRIWVDLQDQGHMVGENRVARLMHRAGLRGRSGRRRIRTTIPAKTPAPFEDLVKRRFAAEEPNQLFCGDITYIRTWEGWLYLASVIDVYSRRCLGWAIADHMRAELVCDALKMAISNRGGDVSGVIFHSDRGSQGGIKWSSQHLDQEVARWPTGIDRSRCVRIGGRSHPRDGRRWPGVRIGSGSGMGSLAV